MLTLLFSLFVVQAGIDNYWYPAKSPRDWVDKVVYPIISDQERKLFLSLQTEDMQRKFVDLFWRYVGRRSGFGWRYKEMYYERIEFALEKYKNLTEDRANVLLVHGLPNAIFKPSCSEVFYPMEFWFYDYVEGIGKGVVVLFVQEYGIGNFRLFESFMDMRNILTIKGEQLADPWIECFDGYETKRLFIIAKAIASDFQNILLLRKAKWIVENEEKNESNYSSIKKMMSFYNSKKELECDAFVYSKNFDGSFVNFDLAVIVDGNKNIPISNYINFDAMLELIDEDKNIETMFYAFTFERMDKYPLVFSGRFRRGLRKAMVYVKLTNSDSICYSELEISDNL